MGYLFLPPVLIPVYELAMVKYVVSALVMSLVACSNGSNSADTKLDSIGKKFDSAAERTWDSTKQKARDIKERVENSLERKDSVNTKADTQ